MIRYFVGKLVFKLINCKDYYLAKHINSKIIKNYGRLGIECKVSHPENIEIGSNSYVNGGYLIASKNAKIIIGKNCLLSYNIHLRTDMHKYENSNILINKQGT